MYVDGSILPPFEILQVALQLERVSVSNILRNSQISVVCICHCLQFCLHFPVSLYFKWSVASWSASSVPWVDKHDHVHQAGATAWSLRPNVPECHLLIPEDGNPGIPLDHGIWIGILHALPKPF